LSDVFASLAHLTIKAMRNPCIHRFATRPGLGSSRPSRPPLFLQAISFDSFYSDPPCRSQYPVWTNYELTSFICISFFRPFHVALLPARCPFPAILVCVGFFISFRYFFSNTQPHLPRSPGAISPLPEFRAPPDRGPFPFLSSPSWLSHQCGSPFISFVYRGVRTFFPEYIPPSFYSISLVLGWFAFLTFNELSGALALPPAFDKFRLKAGNGKISRLTQSLKIRFGWFPYMRRRSWILFFAQFRLNPYLRDP